jgi:subtilisin-like proprotein convertase family protein
VVFDQPVTGFTTGDVVITGTAGGIIALVAGGPTLYNVAISGMTTCGTVIANIPAGVCTNTLSQPNLASTSIDNTVTYGPTLANPNVTINQAASQPDPTSASPIHFTVVFDQVVTGFATGDVTLSGTAGPTTGIVTGSGTTYNVAVSGMTASGTVIAAIAAGVAQNACSQSNNASTSTDNTVSVTCVPPVVNVTPVISCGGVAGLGCTGPLTAIGNADTYTWSPLAGLYTNCSATTPYTGDSRTVVYAAPTVNTIYALTGTILATGCTHTASTQVNYTPPAPLIIPSSVTMCLSDPPVKLRVASGTGFTQFCSGTVNIPVPDNNPTGAVSSVAVNFIPATCTVTGMSVTINMPHTRIGNMVFVLKAPNGNILNLDYHLGATGGTASTTGFVNTIISSAGINALGTGTNPYNGTFKADAQAVPAGGFGVTGPTGMLPTTTNWNSLLSGSVNGNWTLGFYDGVTGDVGTLTSWCLGINYSCTGGIPAGPAVWSPAAGLFFDAAATIPYVAGTARDSVWVRPTPAGVYTYQVTTNGVPPSNCTSPPRNVVVTVGQPMTVTQQPAAQTVCVGASASFTVVTAGAGPFTYQWQQSSDAGATYNNIVNGGVYSGALTNTLLVNAPPVTMNGYLFRVLVNSGSGCSGATSAAALLTVNPLPDIVITANPLVIGPTQTSTITSTVSPNPAATYTWYYNNAVLPGETSSSLLVSYGSPGNYQLKVRDVNGCINFSNIITIANSFALNMYTYPNPSGGIFQVRYHSVPNNTLQRSLTVYNNRGEKIIGRNFTQTIPYQKIDVDVRAHGKGLYWVEVSDANGKRLGIKRVVVQ